jgi:hypothetical protein
MKAAHALYASLAFEPAPAYRFNPLPGASVLVLEL